MISFLCATFKYSKTVSKTRPVVSFNYFSQDTPASIKSKANKVATSIALLKYPIYHLRVVSPEYVILVTVVTVAILQLGTRVNLPWS